jgi:phage terminase small subunit
VALNDKQQAFVEAYLATWNASEAARQADYAKPGQQGHRLLKNVEIEAEIKQRIAEKAMTADEVLVRLAEQARNEHGAYISTSGAIDLRRLIADGKGHLIKGIKRTQFGDNIEFYDAQAALVHIGKHHGLFTDKVEHSGEVEVKNVTELTDEQLARIAAISSGGTTKT